jgi:hypothetical protein
MNHRERFLKTLQFQPVDRVPLMEIGVWQQTNDRWEVEGMPPGAIQGGNLIQGNTYFGLEGIEVVHIDFLSARPAYEERTLQEDERYAVFVDSIGRTRKALKEGTLRGQRMCMDTYIAFPVHDRASFREHRRRYEGPYAERYPANWEALKARVANTDKPLHLLDPMAGTLGFYSMLRNWMGTEGLSYLLYDDPGLVYDCLEFLTDYAIGLLTKACQEIRFDFYYVHEDMSGKGGPLVSPRTFRELFLPFYKRFIAFLRGHGLQTILVDTDGDFGALIPAFLEAGVDGFGPIEVAAGMDPLALRKQYGRSLCMVGGVDKRQIAAGRSAIETEVYERIAPLIGQGGFIPTVDHAVPPDVSFQDFSYYLDLKRKVILGQG